MKLNENVFKAYDIRGVYGTDIDDEGFERIVKAIYTFFVQKLGRREISIVLGRDARTSTPALFERASKVLVNLGATVVDCGLTATPTFYYASLKYGYDAGIMITASHNPKEYNGCKFVIRTGDQLAKVGKGSGMEDVKRIALSQEFLSPTEGGKIIQNTQVLADEISNAMKHIDLSQARKYKIVTDTANGMAITYLDELFNRIPCDVTRMNAQLDGTFPVHEANPLKFETLKDLQKKVLEEKADFGIAPDADGDRIFFIDEKAQIIPATMITCLVANEILAEKPGSHIIVDIRYIMNVIDNVTKKGGTYSISKVGHAFITAQMPHDQAEFAGESSGHYFFKESGYGESSILIVAYLLRVMNREKKPLSEIIAQYHTAIESGETNFELPQGTQAKMVLDSITKDYPNAVISTLDGLSMELEGVRFNIRTSNTEPLMRLNVEGKSEEVVKKMQKQLSEKILSFGATPKH